MQTSCLHCDTSINITGDGSHAYLNDATQGGLYFCSHQCKEAWCKQNVRQTLSGVITGMGSQPIPFTGYDDYVRIISAQYR